MIDIMAIQVVIQVIILGITTGIMEGMTATIVLHGGAAVPAVID
jgi:hypothetical protein